MSAEAGAPDCRGPASIRHVGRLDTSRMAPFMLRHRICVIFVHLRRFAFDLRTQFKKFLCASLKGGKIIAQIRLTLSPPNEAGHVELLHNS